MAQPWTFLIGVPSRGIKSSISVESTNGQQDVNGKDVRLMSPSGSKSLYIGPELIIFGYPFRKS